MKEYKIDTVDCGCHPETCTHWAYYIFIKVGDSWLRTYDGSDSREELELRVKIWEDRDALNEKLSDDQEPVKKVIDLGHGSSVSYTDSTEVRDAVFERVMKYFIKHGHFCGEGICQSDNPIIDAPNVMSDIADDIIKFEYKDEGEV